MEVKQLVPFVLLIVMVGMILGVGLLVLDAFGVSTYTDTTVEENATTSSGAATVTTIGAGVNTLTFFGNSSINTTEANLNIGENANISSDGVLSVMEDNWTDGSYEVHYTYNKTGVTVQVTNETVNSLSPVATTWMSLIVTVAILAIILTLVIRSFAMRR